MDRAQDAARMLRAHPLLTLSTKSVQDVIEELAGSGNQEAALSLVRKATRQLSSLASIALLMLALVTALVFGVFANHALWYLCGCVTTGGFLLGGALSWIRKDRVDKDGLPTDTWRQSKALCAIVRGLLRRSEVDSAFAYAAKIRLDEESIIDRISAMIWVLEAALNSQHPDIVDRSLEELQGCASFILTDDSLWKRDRSRMIVAFCKETGYLPEEHVRQLAGIVNQLGEYVRKDKSQKQRAVMLSAVAGTMERCGLAPEAERQMLPEIQAIVSEQEGLREEVIEILTDVGAIQSLTNLLEDSSWIRVWDMIRVAIATLYIRGEGSVRNCV